MSNLLGAVVLITLAMLVLGLLVGLVRLVLGPSLADRVIALDAIATLTLAVVGVESIDQNQSVYLAPAMVLALVAFLGTVAFALYVERRGAP